mmetsp:Transcript_49060/g.56394  ORF Transcript_49060/g.56394 Transcript_49060/m.56394 type:complete len:171 (-) Transcript_49060:1872-2384(-)
MSASQIDLPMGPLTRVIKHATKNTISKQSKQFLSRAGGVFALYLASAANDIAKEHKRTTVTPEDIIQALEETEFGHFSEKMDEYLSLLKEKEGQKTVKTGKRKIDQVEGATDNEGSEVGKNLAAKFARMKADDVHEEEEEEEKVEELHGDENEEGDKENAENDTKDVEME